MKGGTQPVPCQHAAHTAQRTQLEPRPGGTGNRRQQGLAQPDRARRIEPDHRHAMEILMDSIPRCPAFFTQAPAGSSQGVVPTARRAPSAASRATTCSSWLPLFPYEPGFGYELFELSRCCPATSATRRRTRPESSNTLIVPKRGALEV